MQSSIVIEDPDDAVLLHDAVSYMLSAEDLAAAFATAAAHLAPGGVFVVAPDWRGFGLSDVAAEAFWFPDYLADLAANKRNLVVRLGRRTASRLLPLSALGLVFYIGPTCQLLVAVLIFREPFSAVQMVAFALVWIGLALVTLDSLRRARELRRAGLSARPEEAQ